MRLREPVPVVEVLGLCAPFLRPGEASPELQSALGGLSISALEPPENDTPDALVFLGSRVPLRVRCDVRAAVALAEPGIDRLPASLLVIPVSSVHAAMAALLNALAGRILRPSPFSPGLAGGSGNRVAPSAVVEGVLEGDVTVGAHAYVAAGAYIGRGSRIDPNATVLEHCVIGRDCTVQSGAVIGCAGFGFFEGKAGDGEMLPMPHLAGVDIGEGCFIGANAVIAAGVLRPTTLGRRCKLDSHVQIAHNVRLGDGCLLASQSGIAGSTIVGHRFRMGGAASVDGHLRIGDGVSVAACSGVTKDLPDGAVVAGFPALPIREWRRRELRLRNPEA